MKIFCKDISEIKWQQTPSFILNKSIHIWLAHVQTDPRLISELKKSLSEDELRRSDRFAFEKDRNQFITAHVTVRTILAKYVDTTPAQIQFKKTAYRKPFISQPLTMIKFNISHSENKILIAVAENEIGVDIEKVKDSFEFNQLSKTYFSEKEQREIATSANQKETFYKFWTRKESVLKATGMGITDNLKEIEICNDENYSKLFPENIYISSFKIEEDFFGSIASLSNRPALFFKT
ncbi:MAG: 4'-phosphopantetheinyl transferase superfamily protein [Bacteroidia bacterium]